MVFGNLADSIAVTDPVEVGAPNVGVGDGEGPAAGSGLSDKGMVVCFSGAATARGTEDRLQTSALDGEVELYSGWVRGVDCGE